MTRSRQEALDKLIRKRDMLYYQGDFDSVAKLDGIITHYEKADMCKDIKISDIFLRNRSKEFKYADK